MDMVDFPDDWGGWRLRGRHLVSPEGQRITRERLIGLLWRDELELRRAGYASRRLAEQRRQSSAYQPRIKVIVIDLGEYRLNGLSAG